MSEPSDRQPPSPERKNYYVEEGPPRPHGDDVSDRPSAKPHAPKKKQWNFLQVTFSDTGRPRRSIVRREYTIVPWTVVAIVLFVLLLMWPPTPKALLLSSFGQRLLDMASVNRHTLWPLYAPILVLFVMVVICILGLTYEFLHWPVWSFLFAAAFAEFSCFLAPVASYGVYLMFAATVMLLVDSLCRLRFWEGVVFSLLAGFCTLLHCLTVMTLEIAKDIWL